MFLFFSQKFLHSSASKSTLTTNVLLLWWRTVFSQKWGCEPNIKYDEGWLDWTWCLKQSRGWCASISTCETLGNPMRSRVVEKHPVINKRWESVLMYTYTPTHTGSSLWFCNKVCCCKDICIHAWAVWSVQQYQLELSVSLFLKLEFRISQCWANRDP